VLSDRTRIVFINTPNNPTGQVYDYQTLYALGEALLDYPNVFVVSDDIYEHLCYTDQPYSNIVNACPSIKGSTLVVNGLCKTYARPGWRVGIAAGPANLIAAMTQFQGKTTSHTAAVSQKAAAAAFNGGLKSVEIMVEAFYSRAEQVTAGLSMIDD